MAEVILSPVADLIIQTLGSAAVKKIGALYSVRDDLEELQGTLSTIRAVLLDAERQQAHNNQVRLWLERLEDVVSDADDLVDEVAAEGLRRELTVPGRNRMFKKVRIFCSSSNQLVFRRNLAKEISSVRKRLAAIATDRRDFKLEEYSREEIAGPVRSWRETHSFVVEENVVGRIEDRRRVLELVLEKRESEERVCVVPIFGMGGLGKTTLAQLVFNDKSVLERFHEKIWVCVSDNFNEKLIVGLIVRSFAGTSTRANETMEELQKTLHEKMNGKRYLLVLDDVWNENRLKWQNLMGLLSSCGDSGSRIIVTTRSEKVAKLTSNIVQSCRLEILGHDESWSLFKKIAFKQGREPAEVETVEIGKQILKKCGGNPLAIRMIASMLSFRDPKTEWPSFLKKELSSLPQQENDILPTLKLSYDCLPLHLKHFFAYCRLFPKDYRIDVQTLVNNWVAQGFISVSSDGSQSLEEKGYEYFLELLWRCFFQEAVEDEHNRVETCKMHDLVHDLAGQVAGNKCAILEPGSQENITFEKVRYASYGYAPGGLPTFALQAKRLRSLFRPTDGHYSVFGQLYPKAVVSNFKLLRMLDLHDSGIVIVPNSIGKLKHLRYLDLSYNLMERLPSSITKLINLQTLKLNSCSLLRELPRDMKKLVNLRHLEFRGPSLYQLYLPKGVNQWTNLQTLSYFVISEDPAIVSHCSKLDELMGLNSLRGELGIRGLRSGMETSGANLKAKEHLRIISLEWSSGSSDQDREKTLDGLQPHPDLRELSVEGYNGVRFSNWLSSLTNLVVLRLEKCLNLKRLPSLVPLHSLKEMFIDGCSEMECIATYVTSTDGYSPTMKAVPVFPSLEILELTSLPNLRGWETQYIAESAHQPLQFPSYFPNLTSLTIENCPKLTSMPLYPNVYSLYLRKANGKSFDQTTSMCAVLHQNSKTTTATRYSTTTVPSSTSNSFHPLSQVEILHLCFRSESDARRFPAWMQSLSSLEKLVISGRQERHLESRIMEYVTPKLEWMVEESDGHEFSSDGSDAIEWKAHARLHTVVFSNLPKLAALPEWIHHITTLQNLIVLNCDSLTTIPDSICKLSSLRQLDISDCPKIESLPGSISSLKLGRLRIIDCPILLKWCQGEREDWSKAIQTNR